MKKTSNTLIAIIAVLGIFSNGFAAGKTTKPIVPNSATPWQFEITPYFWLAGLDGHIQIGRLPSTSVDAKPADLLKVLDFGLSGTFEMRQGLWGVVADAMYIELQKDQPSNLFGEVNAKVTQQLYGIAGMYRPIDNRVKLDVLGGARYMNLKAELNVSRFALSRSKDVDWWDGFVGARVLYSCNDQWKLVGYADVGTGGSQISWQALAGVNYEISENFIIKLGYRILSEYYENNQLVYNMRMGGAYLGLGIRF